ncbi:MAG: transketolase C-terminal domain-containing protein [Elusimicrobiota bacterium]|jgi:transketolase
MRKALISTLLDMAQQDDRIVFLTADLGWSVVDVFAERFPGRFINVGVAEANMMGIATGLAIEGYIPFVYSIATFSSMRPYEQFRNGPVLHHLPVRVIGVGGGFAYAHAGPTHYALEDLAIMRAQPGCTVLAPADPAQTRSALLATRAIPGPVYLRVGKGGNPEVPGLNGRFALGQPELVREGSDLLIIATGAAACKALAAAEALAREGRSAAVAVLAHLGQEASLELNLLLSRFRVVLSVEEAFSCGGLGSLIAETVAKRGLPCRLGVAGVRSSFEEEFGSEAWLASRHGIDAASLAVAGKRLLENP